MQIESLSSMVDAIARSCGAKTVVDVGSGQVYHLQFCARKRSFFFRETSRRGQGAPAFRIDRIELDQFIRKTGPKNHTSCTMSCL